MTETTESDVLEALGDVLVTIDPGLDKTMVVRGKKMEKLGVDSLDYIEIAKALEDKFGIEITDEELKGVRTVDDVINLVLRLVGAKEVAPT